MGTRVQSLAHTKWLCKYHIVFSPKYRRKIIFANIRESIGEIFKDLCKYKGVEIIEGHLMQDHMCICWWVSLPKSAYQVSWDTWKGKAHWWFLIGMQTWSINSAIENSGRKDISSVRLDSMRQRSKNTFSSKRSMTFCKIGWVPANTKAPSRGKPKRQRLWAWTKWKPAPLDAGR